MALRGDVERELWRQTRKYISGMPQRRNCNSCQTVAVLTTLRLLPSEYEDKAAERQLDLRRERNTLESAVKSQKDTKHGEFAQFAPPGCSLEQLAVTHLCHATTEIQHQRQHAEQSQKKCNEQRVALLVWNLTMNIVMACCNYQGR